MSRIVRTILALLMPMIIISCGADDTVPAGSGLVEATDVVVSAETGGRLTRLNFDEGDLINSGDTIAVIDTVTTVLQWQQAKAIRRAAETKIAAAEVGVEKEILDAELAEKEYNRIRNLIKTGSANQQQFDRAENVFSQAKLARQSAKTALETARAELERIDADIALLEKQLADCRPLSPLPGTVITKYVDAGELIGIGRPLIKIACLDTVWVKIYLPPGDLTGIKLGDSAEIDPEDGREKPLSGTVTWISSEAEFTPKNVQTKQARADLVYAVKVTIPNQDQTLKIGMPVSVRIP